MPSWTAFAKLQLMERYFPHLVDYDFTATMEEALDLIANGEGDSENWLHDFYFGNGQRGLKDLVGEEHLAEIDPREVNTVEIGKDDEGRTINVRVGQVRPVPRTRRRARARSPTTSRPTSSPSTSPSSCSPGAAEGPQVLGVDPETGLEVIARDGRYGPYVQLGELVDGEEKPKTASLLSSMSLDTITFEDALKLLRLPREVGADAEGHKITAHNGRYGPYLKKGKESRSLETEDEIFTVTVERAEALFAQPKQHRRRTKPPIAELGEHPDTGAPVRVLDGRYGPYVTDGSLNATIPRGTDPKSVNLEEAAIRTRTRRWKNMAINCRSGAPGISRPKRGSRTSLELVALGSTDFSTTGAPCSYEHAAHKLREHVARGRDGRRVLDGRRSGYLQPEVLDDSAACPMQIFGAQLPAFVKSKAVAVDLTNAVMALKTRSPTSRTTSRTTRARLGTRCNRADTGGSSARQLPRPASLTPGARPSRARAGGCSRGSRTTTILCGALHTRFSIPFSTYTAPSSTQPGSHGSGHDNASAFQVRTRPQR